MRILDEACAQFWKHKRRQDSVVNRASMRLTGPVLLVVPAESWVMIDLFV